MQTLEQQIANQINDSLRDAIKGVLSASWSSPLGEMIKEVVKLRETELKTIINNSLGNFIDSDTFKKTLKEEMNHKIAKSCVSMMEGQIEKSLNSIKQDPIMKAKMILALEEIIINNQPK